jgi:hypothetical protein
MSASSSGDPEQGRTSPRVPEAVSWEVADAATRGLAHRTLEVLNTRETVTRLAARYANCSEAHRAGHLFEVMHALSFNREAIRRHSDVRAAVTEWMPAGSQRSASDIDLTQGGHVLRHVQAKLYDSVPATAHELGRDHYDGMQRLVAEDRLDAVRHLLDRKVRLHPDGINTEHFRDAHAHVTDALCDGQVTSQPVSYPQAQQAARNPVRWIAGEAREAAARQVLVGVAAAGGTAAVLDVLTTAASTAARVRATELSPMEAVITSCATAGRTAARAASVTAIGQGLQVASLAGLLPAGVGAGTVPLAMATATVGVAESGYAFATNQIDAAEFAARCAETVARTSIMWAFSTIGQTAIPIPVVGTLAGAYVGQLVATQCVKGLQMSLVAARYDRRSNARTQDLELELLTAAALSEELAALAIHIGVERNAYLSDTVIPRVNAARRSLLLEQDDAVLQHFADTVAAFGRTPLFVTMTEFDAWMTDEDIPLTLDPNWK